MADIVYFWINKMYMKKTAEKALGELTKKSNLKGKNKVYKYFVSNLESGKILDMKAVLK